MRGHGPIRSGHVETPNTVRVSAATPGILRLPLASFRIARINEQASLTELSGSPVYASPGIFPRYPGFLS